MGDVLLSYCSQMNFRVRGFPWEMYKVYLSDWKVFGYFGKSRLKILSTLKELVGGYFKKNYLII